MADTEALIAEALKAEQAEKKAQKQEKHAKGQARKAARKGMTLEQLEASEGGPVKESMVGMAQTRRAAKRKGAGVGDTDLVEDVEDIEEELEQDEENGMKLEAFNLKEERERGYFDASGNYVEREDKEAAEDAADAWLQSDEAKVVSDEVRLKIEAAQTRAAAEEAAGPLSAAQVARLQLQASQVLQPGETVAAALKRLGGHSRRPAKRSRHGGEGPSDASAADAAPDPTAKQQFNQLTEAAMKLMDAGENDVYSQKKEYFERAASVYIDLPGKAADAGPSKAAYEDADEDMFAEDDEKAEPKGASAGGAAQPPASAAAPAPGGPPPSAAPAAASKPVADETDYSSWPIKELRRFLAEKGVDGAGIVEKEEFVAKVKEVAAAGPEGEAPAGYVFDAATGYYHSPETGMYWDAATGGFYSGSDGKWYSWDERIKAFVEWKQ